MTKCFKLMAFLGIIMLNGRVHGKPQDVAGAGLMAFAQVKDTLDNGAAASDKKEFEVFGAKISNDMNVGFGDAARSKRSSQDLKAVINFSRAKRSADNKDFSQQIVNSEEKHLTKRATDNLVDFSQQIVNSEEKHLTKRATDNLVDNSEEYDYSSSSSSSESEDSEARK